LRQRGDRRHALTPHTPASGRPSEREPAAWLPGGDAAQNGHGATGAVEPHRGPEGRHVGGTCPTRPTANVGWTRAGLWTLGTK
jgi:hypothetical protein